MTRDQMRYVIYPLIGIAILLALWQTYVVLFRVNSIVLPSPLGISQAVALHFGLLMRET